MVDETSRASWVLPSANDSPHPGDPSQVGEESIKKQKGKNKKIVEDLLENYEYPEQEKSTEAATVSTEPLLGMTPTPPGLVATSSAAAPLVPLVAASPVVTPLVVTSPPVAPPALASPAPPASATSPVATPAALTPPVATSAAATSPVVTPAALTPAALTPAALTCQGTWIRPGPKCINE